MTPKQRIIKGIGVVGVRCAICKSVILVVNAAQVRDDLKLWWAAYYFCQSCAEKENPKFEANGDGLELLLPD